MSEKDRSVRSRRTNRLTPADDYYYRSPASSLEQDARPDRPSARRAPRDLGQRDDEPRRRRGRASRHNPWNESYGESDSYDDAESAWADDSLEQGARRQARSWEESDADWRSEDHRGDGAQRGALRWSERWGETTRHWMASQRARFRRGDRRRAANDEDSGSWAAPAARRRLLSTRRSRIVAAVVCAALLLFVVAPGLLALLQYSRAKSGLQHFKNAQSDLTYVAAHPFDTATIAHARAEFTGAIQDFSQVGGALGVLPGPLTATPMVGGATRLIPIATKGAQAGVLGCDALSILATKLKDPLTPSTNGLTASDLATISAKYTQIRALVTEILSQVGALQPSDLTLDARLGPALATLKEKLPQIQQLLDDAQVFLDLAPTLFGVDKPASYLMEVLDSTELRAGGGFIGNYGLLTLTGGHLNGLKIQDVDLLDAPYRYGNKVIPIPPGYHWFLDAAPKWGFRDSNLDADFPTSAQNGESLYKLEGGPGELQGVVAITPWMVQSALRITGPVDVPEFKETVNADNMVEQIHKYQLTNGLAKGPDDKIDPNSGTSQRKAFTGFLFQHFMAKVKEQSAQDMGKFVKLFTDSLHSKDVQIYLNADKAENVLRHNHIASAIEAPAAGDSLFVADANIVASKINFYLQNTVRDQVTLDASGTATHQTTLTYIWPPNPDTLTKSFPAGYPYLYISYLRVYAPPTARLLAQSGWQGTVASKQAFGRTEWGGKVWVSYGTTQDITLTWSEPHAATQSGQSWMYTALIQRQAGYTYGLDYHLTLPACAKLVGAPPSGFTAPSAQSLALKQPLAKDVSFTVTYTC